MTYFAGRGRGQKQSARIACSIGMMVVTGVLAAAVLGGSASATQSAAARAQATAIQAARDAARAGESLHDAQAAANAAANRATAMHARALGTRSFQAAMQAKAATARAAKLAAAAARAQVAYNQRAVSAARAQSVLASMASEPAFDPGPIPATTRNTLKDATGAANEACKNVDKDVATIAKAQKDLTKAQAKPKTTPAELAALQAAVDAARATAAASAAVCATATATATTEQASYDGFNDGVAFEGTPTVSENDPFPDNYLHSDNVELVSHVRGIVGGSPSCPAFNPTKCPAYSSLNFVTGYRWLDYDIMVANGTGGLSVWSLKDPGHPEYISAVPFNQLTTATSGTTGTQFWEGENMTVDSARKLVFMSRDTNAKGVFIIDLKDPWNPVLVGFQKTPQGHTTTCINGCRYLWSVGGVQSGSGAGFTGKSSPVSVTDIRDPAHPFTYTTAVQANVTRAGATNGSTHSVDVDFNGVAWVSASAGVRGYWTSGQHYNPATDSLGWATPYAPLPYAGGRITGNTGSFMHNAYHFPNSLNGGPAGDVMLVTNESNNTNCLNSGAFLISSLAGTYDDHGLVITAPSTVPQMARLGLYRPAGKPGEFHGTVGTTTVGDCSAHWFTVRGNLVAQAYYEQGVRFIDVSDPANPVQTGWARVPARAAAPDVPAIVSSNMSAAYWHGDYVYASDYARGVDVFKYNDPIPGVVESKTCWNSCEK